MWCGVLFNRTQPNFITFVNIIHWIVFYSFENTVSINVVATRQGEKTLESVMKGSLSRTNRSPHLMNEK